FYMTDALGSVRYLGGSATGYRFDYFPFGAPILDSDTGDDRYQFTGKERDAESGLDNFGARFNSSSFGRFMSPDPTFESALRVNPQTWNRYSYTLNNPLNYIDPDGELWQQSLTGTWDWMDKCNAGATCVTQIAQQEGNNVVAYGPSSAKDKKTFAANKQGYINVADIEATDGAYFQFQPGVTATYASPQTAVDLYNGAFDYHQEYPDDSKLSLNDIGKPDGAAFDPHLTHNLGRALDMSYMGEDGKPIHRGKLGVWLADDDRMKALVRIFTENGFNQSYSDNDTGLGVNWAHDHMNHIHFGKNLHTGQCEIGPCQ
ncbi:MAG: RHS repeat-associated core domain-containing protein, partial [Candidatus Acidiferrum sp.]